MTQNALILAHLRSGKTLTPAEAYELYGTMVLHSRVAELRSQGHQITCRMVRQNGKSFGEYRLTEEHSSSQRITDKPTVMGVAP